LTFSATGGLSEGDVSTGILMIVESLTVLFSLLLLQEVIAAMDKWIKV
jgi:hypothetical protein